MVAHQEWFARLAKYWVGDGDNIGLGIIMSGICALVLLISQAWGFDAW